MEPLRQHPKAGRGGYRGWTRRRPALPFPERRTRADTMDRSGAGRLKPLLQLSVGQELGEKRDRCLGTTYAQAEELA